MVIDEVGGGTRHERLAVGETPNIAARIQSFARPNQMLVSRVIRAKAEQHFTFESLGAIELSGLSEPIELSRVRELGTEGSAAPSAKNQNVLVGRERELAHLESLWGRSLTGLGQSIMLCGEPGIGKSRLIQEFVERTKRTASCCEIRCAEDYDKSPLFPIKQLIRTRSRFLGRESPEQQWSQLEAELARLGAPADDKFYLAAMLLIACEMPPHFARQAPRERRSRTLEAVGRFITSIACDGPALYIWEDLQAADPSTLELLSQVIDASRHLSLMHLVAVRPGIDVARYAMAGCSQLTIESLGPAETAAMVEAIAGQQQLSGALVAEIYARTEGVPLFVEELTKVILRHDRTQETDRGGAAALVSELAIPENLEDVLIARLDPLVEGQIVAQCASVIGREFNATILRAIAAPGVCATGLFQLLEADLVRGRGAAPFSMYQFKHALIRDVAYGSMLKSERRIQHRKVADAVVQLLPDVVASEPEIIARHYSEAEEPSKALPLWLEAGQIAAERSALQEAQSHFQAGLALLEALPKTAERGAQEVHLREALGPVLIATSGNTAPEVEMNYARALALCERFTLTEPQFPLMFGLRSYHLANADLAQSHALGLRLLDTAQAVANREYVLEAHVALSNTFFFYGDFPNMQKHVRAGLEIFDEALHREHAQRYGLDPGVICLSRSAQCLWHREESARAMALMNEAVALAERRQHPFTCAYALANAAVLCQWRRVPTEARSFAEHAIAIAVEHRFPFFKAWGMVQLASALIELGFHADGDGMLNDALAAADSIKVLLMQPWFLATRAEGYLAMGRLEAGLSTVDDALAIVEHTGATYALPMLYWLRGELHASRGGDHDIALAAESLGTSIRIAQQHDSRAFERRAQTSLDRLLGRATQA